MGNIAYTIPAAEYREPQPIEVPYLTDAEREALSYAYFDKQFEVRTYEDMAGTNGVISGWRDVTPGHEEHQNGRLREAMLSLDRLGLVEGYYEHGSKSRDRIKSTDPGTGHMRVRATGRRYKLTEAGREVQAAHRARIYKCCDGVVFLNCVCREKTFCAEHGGGCHGTHD